MQFQRDALERFSMDVSYARGELGQPLRQGTESSALRNQLKEIFATDGQQASSLEDVDTNLKAAVSAAENLLSHVAAEETELIDDYIRPLLEGYASFGNNLNTLRQAVGHVQLPKQCERSFKVSISKIYTSLGMAETRLRFMTQKYVLKRQFLSWMACGLFHELECADIELSDVACLFALNGKSAQVSQQDVEVPSRRVAPKRSKTADYYKHLASQLDLLMPASVEG